MTSQHPVSEWDAIFFMESIWSIGEHQKNLPTFAPQSVYNGWLWCFFFYPSRESLYIEKCAGASGGKR